MLCCFVSLRHGRHIILFVDYGQYISTKSRMDKTYKYLIVGFEERLKSFFGVQKAQELAEILGENNNTLNHYLTGRNRIPFDLLLKIYESSKRRLKRPVNLAWLLTGEGPETISEEGGMSSDSNEIRRQAVKEFLMDEILRLSNEPEESLKKKEG